MADRPHRLLDRTFDVSIIVKAIDGALEILGGGLLLAINPDRLSRFVVSLTQHELAQDPGDFFARHLLQATAGLHTHQTFGALYLLSHGLVKVVLVVALLRHQRWAYPAMLAFLLAFIGYQGYRLVVAPSFGLALLTVFDAFVAWLVWREYRLLAPAPAGA